MQKNLNDALNAAKKDRKVLSKLIIWESGVSKSQFYRIIKGQEAPSPETKKRISESLGIDGDKFDQLYKQSQLITETENIRVAPKNKRARLFILAASFVLLMGFTFLVVNNLKRPPAIASDITVVEPEDRTLFIKDVTIPDGTIIPVNTEFVKTWRVKNIGKVIWKNRYLMRITPASNLLCSSPAMVPIPETHPGQIVDISVKFKTPHLPGSCRTDWKTADDRGNLYFPDMHGLYTIVTVTE